ncbi:MAG: hypothetical protein AAGA56_22720 [Myxococcota bacterium]
MNRLPSMFLTLGMLGLLLQAAACHNDGLDPPDGALPAGDGPSARGPSSDGDAATGDSRGQDPSGNVNYGDCQPVTTNLALCEVPELRRRANGTSPYEFTYAGDQNHYPDEWGRIENHTDAFVSRIEALNGN